MGFKNLIAAGGADGTLAAAWDSGDLSALSSASWSNGSVTVGGQTATVANEANATDFGPDGTNADDGMIFGFREDQTTTDKAAGLHYLSNIKRLFGGGTRVQTVSSWSGTLRTVNVFFLEGLLYGVQLSTSAETTPWFDDDGAAGTVMVANPSTADVTGADFELYWGSYVSGATTNSYILERVRLWELGRV